MYTYKCAHFNYFKLNLDDNTLCSFEYVNKVVSWCAYNLSDLHDLCSLVKSCEVSCDCINAQLIDFYCLN